MASEAAKAQIKSDEGVRKAAYFDNAKPPVLTIGVGFNLERDDSRELLIMAGVHPAEVEGFFTAHKGGEAEAKRLPIREVSLKEAPSDHMDPIAEVEGKMIFDLVSERLRPLLTERQGQLWNLRLKGFSITDAAKKMDIKPATARVHLGNIRKKYQILK